MLSPSDMQGLWSRSLLTRADATRDTTTWVAWLQGPSLYADLRQPAERPSFAGVTSLGDLSREQLAWLAEQEGFAGRLEQDGAYFVWQRMLDYQPRAISPDSGRLYLEGPVMVEEGRHAPYIEHWHREPVSTSPCAAARLRDEHAGCDGFLVRVGTAFMYARSGVSGSLAVGASLCSYVDEAHSLVAARQLVDCELSFGRVSGSDWKIERSSLPYREGARLAPRMALGEQRCSTSDVTDDGSAIRRSWKVVEIEGDKAALGVASECANEMPPHG